MKRAIGILTLILTIYQSYGQDQASSVKRISGYIQRESFDSAFVAVRALLRTNNNDPAAWYLLGLYYDAKMDDDSALLAYDRSILLAGGKPLRYKLDDGYSDAYQDKGLIHMNRGEYDSALNAYNTAIRLYPEAKEAYLARAYLLGNFFDKVEDAFRDYGKALGLDPDYAYAYYNRSQLYAGLGKLEEAISDLTKTISLLPDQSAKPYEDRAGLQMDLGNYAAALDDYTKAIRLDPQNPYTYLNRGVVKIAQGNLIAGLKDLDEAIGIDPEFSFGYLKKAQVYSENGNYREALVNAQKAVSLDDQNADAYVTLGTIKVGMGDYKSSLDDFDKAIKLNDQNVLAYINKAFAMEKLRYAPMERIKLLDKAAALAPENPIVFYNRAVAYDEQGATVNSCSDIRKAVKLGIDKQYLPQIRQYFAKCF